MNETMELYRGVFATENDATLLVDGTSPRRHRGGARVAHPSRATACSCRSSAGSATCSPRSPSAAGRGAHRSRRGGDRCSPPSAIEAAIARVQPDAARDRAGRHLDDDEPAARRDRRDLRQARRAVLHRRDGIARRQRLRDGRVGPRRRDRRAAEVPRRSVGQRRRSPCRDRAVEVVHARKRVEAGIREAGDAVGARLRALELLRPRHDPRLLGSAAAQPPHRGDVDALRARASARACSSTRGADAVIERHGCTAARCSPGVAGARPRGLRRRRRTR